MQLIFIRFKMSFSALLTQFFLSSLSVIIPLDVKWRIFRRPRQFFALREAEVRRWKMHRVLQGARRAAGRGSTLQFSSRVLLPSRGIGGHKKGFQSDNMKIESFWVDLSEFKDDGDGGDAEGFVMTTIILRLLGSKKVWATCS